MLRKFLEISYRTYNRETGEHINEGPGSYIGDWRYAYQWEADEATTDTIHPDDLVKFAIEATADPDEETEMEYHIALCVETEESENCYFSTEYDILDEATYTEAELLGLLKA